MDSFYYCWFRACNLSMYINVRLVYYKGYDKIYEIILSSLCVFNGSSIPNGYVYTVSGC